MKVQLKVSIITPSYNSSRFIEATILSVINQTYNNIEFIVIDGRSNDGTIKILEKYKNRGILNYISEPDNGMYDAINKGFNLATGDILAYLNSDDRYFPWTVETVVNTFSQDENCIDILFGDSMVENIKCSPEINIYPKYTSTWLRNGAIISQPTVFFKKELYQKIGGFAKDVRLIADCEYWLRAALEGFYFRKVNELLAIELNHEDTIRTIHEDEIKTEKLFLINKYKTKILSLPLLRTLYLRLKYVEKEILTLKFLFKIATKNQYSEWKNFISSYIIKCNIFNFFLNKIIPTKKPIWIINQTE